MAGPRKSEPDPNQIPLPFKIPRASAKGSGNTDNPGRAGAAPKVFARAYCNHHSGDRRTGLILSATHLVWKVHYIMLGKGTSVPCRASGVALCSAPPRDGQMVLNMSQTKLMEDSMHGVRTAKCFHKGVTS